MLIWSKAPKLHQTVQDIGKGTASSTVLQIMEENATFLNTSWGMGAENVFLERLDVDGKV